MNTQHTPRCWLWPNHVISKRDSGPLREEHNALVNSHDALLYALSRHGRHDIDCILRDEANLPGDSRCTCGFSAALALANGGTV